MILTLTSWPGTHDLGRLFHVVLGQLGDVDETLDPFFDLDEGAEGDQLGHPAVDDLVDLAVLEHLLPRVLLGLLEAQGDALPIAVDVEHLDCRPSGRWSAPRTDG